MEVFKWMKESTLYYTQKYINIQTFFHFTKFKYSLKFKYSAKFIDILLYIMYFKHTVLAARIMLIEFDSTAQM